MKKWDSEIVSPLKHFSINLITHSNDEFDRYAITKRNFDKKSLEFLTTAQKQMNNYITDFKKIVNPSIRSAIEEQQVAELQGKWMTNILSSIPATNSEINELFSIKILEAFALHNRNLATNWENKFSE